MPWAARAAALALLASMLAAGLHDASQAWDVGYYHLPFAGRLAGLLPPGEYVLSQVNLARYQGFGLLCELLQGGLWRLTGRPEATNLVAFSAVPVLAWFGARVLGVPWQTSVIGLLAIPLVQLHATSAYVDLPGNAAAAVLVLVVVLAYARDEPTSARRVAAALAAATFAANTKPMLEPIVGLALALLAVRLLRTGARREAALLLLLVPVVFTTPLKNLFLHQNPFFPVRVELLGHALPGVEDPYSSSPTWLEAAPRPVRFACSVLELGLRPLSDPRRWTIDQWTPPGERGYRMGGFFHAYMAFQLLVLAWRGWTDRSREARTGVMAFGVLTAVVSVMPQSHELRYYMNWAIVLVLVNLWLASRAAKERPLPLVVLQGAAMAALAVVLLVTRGVYAYPSGLTFDELVRARVDERAVAGIRRGEHVCVSAEPFDVLWAPAFHRERAYVLHEAEDDGSCGEVRRIP